MKFCSKCGNELRDKAVMCPKCGGEVAVTPVPETQPIKKFCTYCGNEVLAAAVICPKCGCPLPIDDRTKLSNYPQKINFSRYSVSKTKSGNGLQTAAKILLVISCVLPALSACSIAILGIVVSSVGIDTLGAMYLILGVVCLLPLIWIIPMTRHYFVCTASGIPVGTSFKICSLIFVNLIAGILMLRDTLNNN